MGERVYRGKRTRGFALTIWALISVWGATGNIAWCQNKFPFGSMKFTGETNVGNVMLPGFAVYDAATQTYRVTGSGNNMWSNEDDFFYIWKKARGDFRVETEVAWICKGKMEDRKAAWVIRAGLAKDDPYVDAVDHGRGLICLQYRLVKGGTTLEVRSPVWAPVRPDGARNWNPHTWMILERDGNQFTMWVVQNGKKYTVGTVTVNLPENVYAGLGVCSHDSTISETAVFSHLTFKEIGVIPMEQRAVESTLETIAIGTGIRTTVYRAKGLFEAPNWSRDGKSLYFNMDGKIYTIPVSGGTPKLINTGFADKCNNDHGLSPDGRELAISDQSKDGQSRIYILPSGGGTPRLITELGPSYWHGWSPDGRTLAYCAERGGNFDIYTISVHGGKETRLTTAAGLYDGPDYSPDGNCIYFNSDRTGQMKIWRMNADGSDQVQFTPDDDYNDWFAHPSPDGKWIVFLSYDKSVKGHPPDKDVVLRLMSTTGGVPNILTTLFGGQGTINVPSWSPDSKYVAFVSYRLVKP